ncbi:MAG: hypothetical protein ACR2QM_14120, partial [Longimicrobiales bacterium]
HKAAPAKKAKKPKAEKPAKPKAPKVEAKAEEPVVEEAAPQEAAAPEAPAAAVPTPEAKGPEATSEPEESSSGGFDAATVELPKVADLAGFLAGIDNAADVKALSERDTRKTAAPLYAARIEEIEG